MQLRTYRLVHFLSNNPPPLLCRAVPFGSHCVPRTHKRRNGGVWVGMSQATMCILAPAVCNIMWTSFTSFGIVLALWQKITFILTKIGNPQTVSTRAVIFG